MKRTQIKKKQLRTLKKNEGVIFKYVKRKRMEVQNLTCYLLKAREPAKLQEMDAKEIEPKQTTTTTWNPETIPKVMKIVSTKLPQRDLISLLLVSPWLYRTLTSFPPLWMVCSFLFSLSLWINF